MLTRPPRPTIRVAVATIGMLTLNVKNGDKLRGETHKQARVWITVDGDPPIGTLIYAYNDSKKHSRVSWVEAGTILTATHRKLGGGSVWDFDMDAVLELAQDGDVISGRIVVPPGCSTCGMGAIGSAGPSDDPHYVDYVRSDQYAFIRRS